MIWKLEDIKKGITTDRIKTHIVSPPYLTGSDHTKIAIIGGGPKGMYGLERLLAQADKNNNQEPLEIHLFNNDKHFGSGNNYRIDQPEYLLINYSIGNINMWIDETPLSSASNTLTLLDWINLFRNRATLAKETDYASRALVGLYLQYGLSEMLENIPSNLMVKLILGHVTDIMEMDGRYKLSLDGGLLANTYDHVLLATGHSNKYKTVEEEAYRNFADKYSQTYFIPHVYPVQKTLMPLPNNLTVAIKGMGLTFIDAALALTEGRGGTFIRQNGSLHYHKSGREPSAIFAYSRGGFPMLPRGPLSQNVRYKTRYFTASFASEIQDLYPKGEIDFEKTLLPVIEQEYTYAYYSTWMKKYGYEFPVDLPYSHFEKEVRKFRSLYKEVPDFEMATFLSPWLKLNLKPGAEFHHNIVDYLDMAIKEAKIGELDSPLMTAVAVWREITPLISPLYEFGGFTPSSQKVFEKKYYGRFSNVTFGPPIENMEKIVALAKASILKFTLGPSPLVNCHEATGKYRLTSSCSSYSADASCLIDARIAKPTSEEGVSEIYSNLIQRNIASPYKNKTYAPGCLNITREGYLIPPNGEANHRIALTGTPTEGATLDNDTLSRTRNNLVSAWAKAILLTSHTTPVSAEKH